MTKTQRLLQSFAAVELRRDYLNYGDETGLVLRQFGMAPSVATALIRWGEKNELVCTFENGAGKGPNCHHWQPAFLSAAVAKHLALFGEAGRADILPALMELCRPKNA